MSKPINAALGLWLACFHALCLANTTLAQDVQSYDWLSLLFAMAAGLLGGAGRTVLTLVDSRQVVGNVRIVLLKDLVVAVVGGGVAYLCIQGYNAWAASLTMVQLPPIARDLRVLIILAAGYSRGRWLGVVDRFATDAIERARTKLGGGPPDLPAAVATAPVPLDASTAN